MAFVTYTHLKNYTLEVAKGACGLPISKDAAGGRHLLYCRYNRSGWLFVRCRVFCFYVFVLVGVGVFTLSVASVLVLRCLSSYFVLVYTYQRSRTHVQSNRFDAPLTHEREALGSCGRSGS